MDRPQNQLAGLKALYGSSVTYFIHTRTLSRAHTLVIERQLVTNHVARWKEMPRDNSALNHINNMKTHILRLGSVVPHGVGGPEAGMINLIYAFLLQEYETNLYSYIHINQIGEDLDELILNEGKKVHINIRYPVYDDFELKSAEEKNRIRLEVVHTALLRIAEKDKKLDASKLQAIKNRILESNFSFDFIYKTHPSKKNQNLVSKIIVHPETDRFDFYIVIEENEKLKCKQLIYRGGTTDFYIDALFSSGKWNGENKFIVAGKEKGSEVHLFVNECKVKLVNLTPYEKPPYFEMMRADISQEEKDKAYKNWKHSLPPSISSVLDYEPN